MTRTKKKRKINRKGGEKVDINRKERRKER